VHPQPLIHAVVQETMILVAHLATAGGVRAPLAGVANQVFADLSDQLAAQGVTKTVIAVRLPDSGDREVTVYLGQHVKTNDDMETGDA